MATINDFKREISELVKAQKVAKRINHQSEVYRNSGYWNILIRIGTITTYMLTWITEVLEAISLM
jgi:hypothetical protein